MRGGPWVLCTECMYGGYGLYDEYGTRYEQVVAQGREPGWSWAGGTRGDRYEPYRTRMSRPLSKAYEQSTSTVR